MFSFLCMYSFIEIKPELHSEIGTEAIGKNQCFFPYWIKFLLTLFEEHPIIFVKLFNDFITVLKP